MILELFKVIMLGIVEGLTEFLPVSSTGHLILAMKAFRLNEDDSFWKMFLVVIQIGAIMAVVVYFWERIIRLLTGRSVRALSAPNLMEVRTGGGSGGSVLDYESPVGPEAPKASPVLLVFIGTVPVLVAGLLVHKWVEAHLEKPIPVAIALIVGGLLMVAIEWLRPQVTTRTFEGTSPKQALWVGLAQILAVLFPGTSRSAATILGGMIVGMSRSAAAEFSFFLAIPAMSAACLYSLYKYFKNNPFPGADKIMLLIVGTLVSFLVAWVIIGAFMAYVRRKSFVPFGVYRIILGAAVLAMCGLSWL